jgi:uncharacterized protein (DUF169 family)
VKYYNEKPPGNFITSKQMICQSILDASAGLEILIDHENSICRGGSYFLGLLEYTPRICNFWTNIEKSHANYSTALSFIRNIPSPPDLIGSKISLVPINKCNTIPDLVIFICNPAQLARLSGLHIYSNGIPFQIYSYTAACAAAIGIPMVTGDLHVSFIDNSARYIADYKDDEMLVTIPACKVEAICNNIEKSIWGTADAPYKEMEKEFKGTTWERKT